MMDLIKLVFFVALVNEYVQNLLNETYRMMEKANAGTATLRDLERLQDIFSEIEEKKNLLASLPKP